MVAQMNNNVRAVCDFIHENFPAAERIGIAEAVGRVAPVIWDGQPNQRICAIIYSLGGSKLLGGESISDNH